MTVRSCRGRRQGHREVTCVLPRMAHQTLPWGSSECVLRVLLVLCTLSTGRCDTLMETVMATAGDNVTLPCPGLAGAGAEVRAAAHGGYLVSQLTWKCPGRRGCPAAADDNSGRLAEFSGGSVAILGDRRRLSVDRHAWSLTISPAQASDSGSYSCSFNSQASDRRVVLVVLGVASPPGRPMVIKHTSRRIDLSWAPSLQTNNSPIKHYIVQTRFGDSGSWPAVSAGYRTQDSQTNASIANLTPFTVYTFRVVAVNGQGFSRPGPASYPVSTLRERPGAPPKLTFARNRSATSIEVGWLPPANHTLHGEFTGYRLTHRRLEPGRPPGPLAEVAVHDVADRSYFIEHLEPYTQYEITLQVKNPEDLGPPAFITATTGEGVPSRPENVSVPISGVRDRTVSLRWVPPRQPNGVLRGYNAYWTSNKEPIKTRRVLDGNLRSFTITNLEPDRQYSMWLKAVTAAGEGDRSFPVQVRTDVSGPGAPIITNITCPTDASLTLQWRRPQVFYGLVAMYYLLYRSGDSVDFVERMVPVQSDRQQYSINLPNLTAGQVYEIRIQGATVSRLSRNKVYKGQQSLPRKVRMARGCEEIQLYSTWQHRPPAALAGSQLTAVFVVACLLALLAVVAAVVWRRRQRRYPAKPADKSLSSAGAVLSGWSAPSHEAVPAHLFAQHVRQLQADSSEACRREWEMLQMAAPLVDDSRTNGATKNGPNVGTDVLAERYQLTQVPLSSRLYRSRPVPAAYYVDGYQKARAFIVTERPAASATDALWRLVWEQGVTGIVLIGTLEKGGRLWPDWGAARPAGDLQLELRDELQLAACCVRKLAVSKLKSKPGGSGRKERAVTLFQYTYWPEYGLPDDPLPLLDFVQRTQRHEPQLKSPLLLISGSFCGAGLYLGLVTLLTQMKYRAELGVFSYWQHIIGQCPNLLPTMEEYSLLHECLLERISAGETLVTRDGARHYIDQLETAGDNFLYPPAEKQYKHAIAMEARQYMVASAAKPCNETKNRSLSYIPMEASRVRLKTAAAADGADYINASWLPGYRLMQEYILTQHPVSNTVLDFWQMVWDHRVTTVTCLSPEDFGTFWPLEEEELTGASFVVRYMSETADCSDTYKSSWIIRSFLMESTEGDDDVTVRIVHLPLWPEECSSDSILEGVLGVTEIQGQRHTPLVVIDRYGGTEGASFCVLSTVLRQLRQETCFDIFTYAKLYHQRRPGIWKTMREFLYLYHAVEAWLSVRHAASLYRSDSCTSICQNRSSLEVKLSGVDGVVV